MHACMHSCVHAWFMFSDAFITEFNLLFIMFLIDSFFREFIHLFITLTNSLIDTCIHWFILCFSSIPCPWRHPFLTLVMLYTSCVLVLLYPSITRINVFCRPHTSHAHCFKHIVLACLHPCRRLLVPAFLLLLVTSFVELLIRSFIILSTCSFKQSCKHACIPSRDSSLNVWLKHWFITSNIRSFIHVSI